MALMGDQLKINGPEYYIHYPNGTTFHLGRLLLRERGYSHYYKGLSPYNNIFVFENMQPEHSIQESSYHRKAIFYEERIECCCIGFQDEPDIIYQTYTQK